MKQGGDVEQGGDVKQGGDVEQGGWRCEAGWRCGAGWTPMSSFQSSWIVKLLKWIDLCVCLGV